MCTKRNIHIHQQLLSIELEFTKNVISVIVDDFKFKIIAILRSFVIDILKITLILPMF